MSDEERIRAYLRRRADVPVPDDLRWPTTDPGPRRRWAIGSVGAWGRVAAAALVLAVVVVGVSVGLAMPSGPGQPSAPPAGGSAAPTNQPPDTTFPSEVAGLPVISVADAVELLQSGELDGRAVAVAGYFDQFTPSCPYPGRYIGPLEGWCRFVAFTDSRAGARLCQPIGANGMSCGQPSSGPNLSPWFMTETSGNAWSWSSTGATGEPTALVLIGHAGDARQWQCTAATQAECASAFVVDRVAWAEGQDLPPAAPETGDQQTGKVITPRMTLAQIAAAAGLGDDLLTGAAFRKGDIANIDPRWNLAGDDIVWLVRSLGPAAGSDTQGARPVTVWLVDDATGHVLDSHPLKLAADYQPARLWQMATIHRVECCAGDVYPFYRMASGDGTVVYEGLVSGGSSGDGDSTTYGGGYGSGVLVLPAGSYSITVWLATYDGGVTGTPRDECSMQVTLRPLDDVALNADYPPNGACTFQPAPAPSPGS
ncbi:MAG: hypothetical protein AB1627_00930 [Chloroflexota bacterium]